MAQDTMLCAPLNSESHAAKTDPLFGSSRIVVQSRLCSKKEYRQSDVGKYAATLNGSEGKRHWLAPDGSTSKRIPTKGLLSNSLKLFDDAEDAVSAVTGAWNVFSEEIERDVVDHYRNAPIGTVYRVVMQDDELTLSSVMYCHERIQ